MVSIPPDTTPGTSKKRKSTTTNDPSPEKDKTRKYAQASRTLKACELCRKQKTRCFRSPENPNSCLRCRFLSKTCSFENEETEGEISGMLPFNLSNQETTKKIDMIHDGINQILNYMKNGARTEDAKLLLDASESMKDRSNSIVNANDQNIPQFDSFKSVSSASPIAILQQLFPHQCDTLITNPMLQNTTLIQKEDVITLGILSEHEVTELISNFRRNYGRWVSFPSSVSTENLIVQIKEKSDLLLTSCCLVSFRYYKYKGPNNRSMECQLLTQHLTQDLNNSLVKYTSFGTCLGQVEFLQALVILSIYLKSLSKLDHSLNLDPWFLSNIGLSTFITKTALIDDFKEIDDETVEIQGETYNKLTILRIYNHLCLAHILNCIFSGRMCILDSNRVEKCATTLSLLNATNFDGRMVSEIGLLFITYKYLQNVSEIDSYQKLDHIFEKVVLDIKSLFVQWEYLFSQPALHFLEFNYNFCSMLVYYVYCFTRLKLLGEVAHHGILDEDIFTDVFQKIDNEKLLETMYEYCLQVISHTNNIENDSYFAYLSDQIHFTFYFCCVFMIKLQKVMTNKDMLPAKNRKRLINVIQLLIDKFERISTDYPHDIIVTYKNNLETCLKENFI